MLGGLIQAGAGLVGNIFGGGDKKAEMAESLSQPYVRPEGVDAVGPLTAQESEGLSERMKEIADELGDNNGGFFGKMFGFIKEHALPAVAAFASGGPAGLGIFGAKAVIGELAGNEGAMEEFLDSDLVKNIQDLVGKEAATGVVQSLFNGDIQGAMVQLAGEEHGQSMGKFLNSQAGSGFVTQGAETLGKFIEDGDEDLFEDLFNTMADAV